jgi:hypothetical protein
VITAESGPTAHFRCETGWMSSEVVVGMASAAVGALAVVAGAITAVRSLAVQQESTRLTLQAQKEALETQERLLRDRSVAEALRQRRATVYASVVRWAYDLLAALSVMDEEHQALPLAAWHLDREAEDECDLYSSDGVHMRFSALRGLLIGLVQGLSFTDSPVVTWEENDGQISNVVFSRTPPLTTWTARQQVRNEAHDATLGLIGRIRAELQDRPDSRVFVTYRLDRPPSEVT